MTAWKNLERMVAKKLGGKRVYRGADFSKSLPDVDHPQFAIECKYRKTISKLYYKPFFVIKPPRGEALVLEHKDRIVLLLDTLVKLLNGEEIQTNRYNIPEEKKYSKFLEDALEQAKKYNKEKIPMVVFKQREMIGELVYMNLEHYFILRTDNLVKAVKHGV